MAHTVFALTVAFASLWTLTTTSGEAPVRTDPGGTSVINPDSAPQNLTVLGEDIIFTADDGVCGRELWRYRPRTNECGMIRDIFPGQQGCEASNFVQASNAVYFLATNGIHGVQLWRTEGTAVTTDMVYSDGIVSWHPKYPNRMKDFLLFQADGRDNQRKLWRTDGTPASTVVLQNPAEPRLTPYPAFGVGCGDLYYFWADEFLYQTNGTPRGTRKTSAAFPKEVKKFNPLLLTINGKLLAKATTEESGEELWVFNPADASNLWRPLRDINPGKGDSGPDQFTEFKGFLYFHANDSEHGIELWRTDGTTEGTTLLKDLVKGRASSDPQYFKVAHDLLFFTATDPEHGRELWVTDGTANGTHLVKDVYPNQGNGTPYQMTPFGAGLIFVAENPDYGEELWFTAGTEQGTYIVKDINPGKASAEPYSLVVQGGVLYFSAKDGIHGEELWRSDGTEQGTRLVADIHVPPGVIASSNPSRLTELNGKVLFFARNLQDRYVLYTSTDVAGGTVPLDSPIPPQVNADTVGIAKKGGWVFLLVSNADTPGLSLWKTDGTTGGTVQMDNMPEDAAPTHGASLAILDDTIYYAKRDSEHGTELWACAISDGAPAIMRDLAPGPASSCPHNLTTWKGALYFAAKDAGHGVELWRHTNEGTLRLADISSGAASSSPELLTPSGAFLYFTAEDAERGRELWRTDGSADGTIPLEDILPGPAGSLPRNLTDVDGILFFAANDGAHGYELWSTDGTASGTKMVRDIFPGRASSAPAWLVHVNHSLFFSADDGIHGAELWQSDGTVPGTFLVGDIAPGPAGSGPANLREANGDLYFSAFDPKTGREPWTYRITHPEITSPFRDICDGPGSSDPGEFCAAGSRVFFRADDGIQGVELWSIDTEAKTHLVRDILVTNPVRAKVTR